jgi:dihydroorotate dehydrogenase
MYRLLYTLLLARLEAEWIHHRSLELLRLAAILPGGLSLLRALGQPRTASTPIEAFGLRFRHPLGLAGGFDKDGRALRSLAALGFSFIEVGTITPRPQPGNPAPRLFRLLDDQALINRMGFPSAGMNSVGAHLHQQGRVGVPVFISLGKNKDTPLDSALADYRAVQQHLLPVADAFVVNVSSPNTPDLRRLQTPAYLHELLSGLQSARPLLVKIAPDLTDDELDAVLQVATDVGLAGIIATNTTLTRPDLRSPHARESGGLSGAPLRTRSTAVIRSIQQRTGGTLPIIGVGGIFTAADVQEKLEAGATLVQAYTGFIYKGPGFVRQALEG